ncbi:MAG TPA: MBL fold metallo-hydrolase [Alkalispirochaeta sp.]|nr:MBL fold metallo-hydrolase [Alkalispirochaeta sp.]
MKVLDRSVTLTNEGQLWIYFLGCGSAFSRRHYQTNLLIIKGEDHLLVDCGTSCTRALRSAGLTVLDINDILITHSHADHAGGLEELMLMNRYVAKKKPRIYITPRYQRILWNQSLRGGAEMNERHKGKGLGFSDYWTIHRPLPVPRKTRDAHQFTVGGITIRTFRTRHYPEQAERWDDAMYTIGIVVDERIIISGDTQFDADLITDVEPEGGAEHIFHDVQLFPGGIHASLEQVAGLPESLRNRMSLVHYGDNFEEHQSRVNELGFVGFTQEGVIYEF